jgi:hypothetical protein
MMKKYVILVLISVVSYSSAKSVVQTSCPFVEGLAVYKARALWALWEPSAVFDDRGLCAQGQNKNQDNNNIDEFMINSLKELTSAKRTKGQSSENETRLGDGNQILTQSTEIKVYPNPANTQITIAYISEANGQFLLYNTLGEVVLKTTLSKENSKTQITITDVATGIYHYEIIFAGREKTVGNISILK